MLSLRSLIASAVALFALAAVSAGATERIVAGFGFVPPLHYRDAQDRPVGFVIDVLQEAARHENVEIVWRRVGGSNDIERALTNGTIDIFPAGLVTERRQARYWVSEPWWSEDLSLLVRADKGIASTSDLRGRRLALTSPAYGRVAGAVFPGASLFTPDQYDTRGGPPATAALVCKGQADGAVMVHLEVDEVLLDRPAECERVKLSVFETAESLALAIIARREKAELAARLRNRIDGLALDGTLARIASHYPRIPARSAVALAETVRTRYERRVLWTAFAGAMALFGFVGLLLLRQMRIQRALRRSMIEQAKTERALRSRTQELTSSNEELQAFAYSVSHDLQEPLRMISLYAELLDRRCPRTSEDVRTYLGFLRNGALRMQEMVSNLLVYSRMGRTDRPQTTVSVQDIINDVLHDLEYQVQATSAEIVIGPMPSVEAWPDRLDVLFQNLISNALKYHRKDVKPRVEIKARRMGNEWHFTIADNGIGFKPEYAEKIFDAFKRLHGRDDYGGTGLGLAIAKRVVERHGGRIWAEGRPNEGSTFTFTLPATSSTAREDEPRTVSRDAEARTP